MKVRIINKSDHPLPHYETIASAGMDLRANVLEPSTIGPLERAIVKTGLFIELPIGETEKWIGSQKRNYSIKQPRHD